MPISKETPDKKITKKPITAKATTTDQKSPTTASKPVVGKRPAVLYKFFNVPIDVQISIQGLVEKNIQGKIDTYLQKIYSKNKDAEVKIDYKIHQNKQKRYESTFIFSYDGKKFVYKNKTAFRFTDDLVNHAFARFKEYLSTK